MIRNVHLDDALAICEIYNHYILESPATFEEVPLAPEEMRQRIMETTKTHPWLVWEEDGRVLGYAYGHRWRERAAYRHSVEASVYLHPSATGKGTGSTLVEALVADLRARKSHCVIAELRFRMKPVWRC